MRSNGEISSSEEKMLPWSAAFTTGIQTIETVQETQYSSFLRKRLCKKPSLGCAGGKPNPLNPPYQGDLSLNSPLTRGARGVRKDEYWIFAQSRKQEPSKTAKPARVFHCNVCRARVSCTVSIGTCSTCIGLNIAHYRKATDHKSWER